MPVVLVRSSAHLIQWGVQRMREILHSRACPVLDTYGPLECSPALLRIPRTIASVMAPMTQGQEGSKPKLPCRRPLASKVLSRRNADDAPLGRFIWI